MFLTDAEVGRAKAVPSGTAAEARLGETWSAQGPCFSKQTLSDKDQQSGRGAIFSAILHEAAKGKQSTSQRFQSFWSLQGQ